MKYKYNRYEKCVLDNASLSKTESAELVEIIRLCRKSCFYSDTHKKTIWNVSINVSGPLIVSFVKWCLDKAREMHLNRLYFLARDGQILAKIAEILKKKYKYDIEIKYLYASRQALLLPAVIDVNDETKEWILAPTSHFTLRMILKRVGIEIETISNILKEYGFNVEYADDFIPFEERDKVRSLFNDKRLHKRIKEKATVFRLNATGYFMQEGLFTDEDYALVDIGWNGTLQRSISRMLNLKGYTNSVKGFYFGIRSRKLFKEQDTMEAFFSDQNNLNKIERLVYIVPMMELFVAADHGGVSSYKKHDDKYSPVLRSDKNDQGISWGIDVQHKAYQYLVKSLIESNIERYFNINTLTELLKLFLITPELNEAIVYGSYPLAEEQNESYFTPLAQKYTISELLKVKKNKFRHNHNEWDAGALRMSSFFIKKILGL